MESYRQKFTGDILGIYICRKVGKARWVERSWSTVWLPQRQWPIPQGSLRWVSPSELSWIEARWEWAFIVPHGPVIGHRPAPGEGRWPWEYSSLWPRVMPVRDWLWATTREYPQQLRMAPGPEEGILEHRAIHDTSRYGHYFLYMLLSFNIQVCHTHF